MGDLIARYLDDLRSELRVVGRERERIVAEAADHLREATRALVAAGLPEPEAQVVAIDRFGAARDLADRFNRASLRATLAGLGDYLVTFVGVGLLTIGLSGLLGWGLSSSIFGKDFVSGNPPGTTISPARCADYLGFHPEAGDCYSAAVAHHYDEFVGYHLDALALGVIVLLAHLTWRRYRRRGAQGPRAHHAYVALATGSFALAASVLLPLDIWQTARNTSSGGGAFLVEGTMALVVSAAYASRSRAGAMRRELRRTDA